MKEFIAYEGNEFVIEWYYDRAGKSSSLEYFLELDPMRQDRALLKRLDYEKRVYEGSYYE